MSVFDVCKLSVRTQLIGQLLLGVFLAEAAVRGIFLSSRETCALSLTYDLYVPSAQPCDLRPLTYPDECSVCLL